MERNFKLLDLFCGAGGAAMGYRLAGFEDITGIDDKKQKRYPFKFIHADALEFLKDHINDFDLILASPPCQKFSKPGKGCAVTLGKEYPDLITPLLEILDKSKTPYIIENVPFAPIRPDLKLFGTMFGLRVRRERWFQLGNGIFLLCPLRGKTALTVTNGGLVTIAGNGSSHNRIRKGKKMVYGPRPTFYQGNVKDTWSLAIGIDWMTVKELAQAIPPAYTQWIGQGVKNQLKDIYDETEDGQTLIIDETE